MRKLEAYADEFAYNNMEINDPKIGVIAAGRRLHVHEGGLSQLFVPQARHGLAAAEEADRRVLQEGEEGDHRRGARSLSRNGDQGHGLQDLPRQGRHPHHVRAHPRDRREVPQGKNVQGAEGQGEPGQTCRKGRRTCAPAAPTGGSFTPSRRPGHSSSGTSAAMPCPMRLPFSRCTRTSAWARA